MAILSKACNPECKGLENLALQIFEIFFQILLNLNLSLNVNLSRHSYFMWDKLGSGNFSVRLSSFNPIGFCYSYAWSSSLYEGRSSFCMRLISRKLYKFLLIFLTGFTSLSALLLFPLSITFFVFSSINYLLYLYAWFLILFHSTQIRFSQSTHLLMCLSFESLTSITKTGFNQPSQMLYNVIFPTESNSPIRSRYIFYFIFSLTFKAFMMFVTFLLFQSNLYVVLARGKGSKNSIIEIFARQKTLNKKSANSQKPDFPKYFKMPSFQNF